jgi:hypothetical protein
MPSGARRYRSAGPSAAICIWTRHTEWLKIGRAEKGPTVDNHRSVTNIDPRSHDKWPLWLAMALALIWVPSLDRGFCEDDFLLVPITFSTFLENPLWGAGTPPPVREGLPAYRGEGRPVSSLTYALLPAQAHVQHVVSLLLYLACLWLMWRVCSRLALAPRPTLFALSSFFHPAFLWNVTWIAHRYDLLVIALLLLAVLETRVPIKVALIGLGSGAKPPLFFQNFVFAYQFARQGRIAAGAVTLFWLAVFAVGIYLTRYTEESAVADSLYTLPVVISIPLRIVKLFEGLLYVFAPIPMFAVTAWMPFVALAAYGALWVAVLRSPMTSVRESIRRHGWIPAMAAAMSVPFLFASDVRITGAAAVMTFLWLATVVRCDGVRMTAIVAILVLNLTGIFLNYGAFRSAQYDIRADMAGCNFYSQPVYAFAGSREKLRRNILTVLGIRTEFRKFP